MNPFEVLADLFERNGSNAYLGEPVSQEEHALQAAWLAEREGASHPLVVAALLHDIGHFLDDTPEDLAEHGIDGRHEQAGASWLARVFGPEVIDPIRLHVPAKRYLCAMEPSYLGGLSSSSKLSLQLQGGPFTIEEIRRFQAEPYHQDAVRLRRWDDAAKVPGLLVPGLGHYRSRIESLTFADVSTHNLGGSRSASAAEAPAALAERLPPYAANPGREPIRRQADSFPPSEGGIEGGREHAKLRTSVPIDPP